MYTKPGDIGKNVNKRVPLVGEETLFVTKRTGDA